MHHSWVLVLPRRSWRPLSDTLEVHKIKQGEKSTIKENLTPQLMNSLSRAGLAAELKKLDIRLGENTEDLKRETVLNVLREGRVSCGRVIRGDQLPVAYRVDRDARFRTRRSSSESGPPGGPHAGRRLVTWPRATRRDGAFP